MSTDDRAGIICEAEQELARALPSPAEGLAVPDAPDVLYCGAVTPSARGTFYAPLVQCRGALSARYSLYAPAGRAPARRDASD